MCFDSGETHITSDILALGNTRRGATHITVTLQQFLSSRPTRRQEQAKELPHTKDHQGLCFSFDTRRALETEISKWSLVVFVGFAMKPLILEHPSFFLQVRNNGGDSFPNTVNSCGEIQKLSLMEVLKQRQYIENFYSYLCLILNKCNLNPLKFSCPMPYLNVSVISAKARCGHHATTVRLKIAQFNPLRHLFIFPRKHDSEAIGKFPKNGVCVLEKNDANVRGTVSTRITTDSNSYTMKQLSFYV